MDQFDAWADGNVARWVPHVLLLCVPLLLAWFSGFNARQRGHEHARRIAAASRGTLVLTVRLAVASTPDVLALLLPYVLSWTGTVVWSYGRHDLLPAAVPACGFEIVVFRPLRMAR
jgi:hypothetical protein